MESFNTIHRPISHILYALFIIFSTTIPISLCEIKNTRIVDDSRALILFEKFGFYKNGHVSISLEDVSWKLSNQERNKKSHLKPSSMGFFLVRHPAYTQILIESETNRNFCVLSSQYIKPIFNFEKLSDNKSYDNGVSTTIEESDEYSLVFGNCQPEFQVSMHVHTEMYNDLPNGGKDFLPAGQTNLPQLYFLFFLLYVLFLGIWILICMKQRNTVDKIHVVMAVLLLVKALKMVCAAEDKWYVRNTGTPHGWDIAFYIFGFFKGIMLFTVIVLIGTGWSFLKPYLQEREKKVLMVVIPLQVLENIASAIVGETGPATKDWMTWNETFLLIDIVCCCAVFFPIVWSIRNLKEASETDGKAARNLEKLTLFKQFYIVVVVYLYFTRVVVLSIGAIISYRYEWVLQAASESASLAFYVFIFYNFQPAERNPYLKIDEDHDHHDENSAGQILEEDDDPFEL
ncbi:hypothetical protein FEM48_Zijuj02G0174200 [Ziziphus jujuba var. spinosa]|uniref:Protein GPR107-like n=1 Tax=Ziziphus jujuba var. spinosa TaxID=714518 RepID=A0A978VWZ8_ZIZJJ|nr:hypothetical protein FEM48_Zijuj02G0174200 [Ziziphus jujuba var. spinosa]